MNTDKTTTTQWLNIKNHWDHINSLDKQSKKRREGLSRSAYRSSRLGPSKAGASKNSYNKRSSSARKRKACAKWRLSGKHEKRIVLDAINHILTHPNDKAAKNALLSYIERTKMVTSICGAEMIKRAKTVAEA